jgi:hypothetical protein
MVVTRPPLLRWSDLRTGDVLVSSRERWPNSWAVIVLLEDASPDPTGTRAFQMSTQRGAGVQFIRSDNGEIHEDLWEVIRAS